MGSILKIGLVTLVLAIVGCASTPEPPPEGQGFSVAESNPLHEIKSGMTMAEVRSAVGEPDGSRSYTTGKQWIPFYFGTDTARTEWSYDSGVVVFSHNQYTGGQAVVDVQPE